MEIISKIILWRFLFFLIRELLEIRELYYIYKLFEEKNILRRIILVSLTLVYNITLYPHK